MHYEQIEPGPESEDDRRGSLEVTQSPQMLSSVQNLLILVRQKKNTALGRVRFLSVVPKHFLRVLTFGLFAFAL